MIPGYNHNVQYKNKIYHIQTEDSGVQNPHIITLLYIGGNILARKKTSYEDILKSERLNQVVKEMMQEQHKGMLRDLKAGLIDERIFADSKPPAEAVAPAPAPVAPPAPVAQPAPVQAQVPPVQPAVAPRPPVAPQRPPAPAQMPAAPRPPVPSAPRPVAAQPPVAQKPAPPRVAPPQVIQPKPAPPPEIFTAPPPTPPPPTAKLIELSDDVELRDEDIFGSDLISDKSLDEVILNYLAQNIEEE